MATFGIFWFQTSAWKLVILLEGLVGFPYSPFETTKLHDEQQGHHVSTVPQSGQTGSVVRQDSCSKGRKSYFIGSKAVGVCGLILRLRIVPPLKTNSAVFPLSSTPSWHCTRSNFPFPYIFETAVAQVECDTFFQFFQLIVDCRPISSTYTQPEKFKPLLNKPIIISIFCTTI